MARSLKEAKQELERLQSMHRSMPDQRDTAAVEIARKIDGIKAEIAQLEAGGGAPAKKKKGGVPWPVLLLIAVALGGAAFALAFFGGQMATP